MFLVRGNNHPYWASTGKRELEITAEVESEHGLTLKWECWRDLFHNTVLHSNKSVPNNLALQLRVNGSVQRLSITRDTRSGGNHEFETSVLSWSKDESELSTRGGRMWWAPSLCTGRLMPLRLSMTWSLSSFLMKPLSIWIAVIRCCPSARFNKAAHTDESTPPDTRT